MPTHEEQMGEQLREAMLDFILRTLNEPSSETALQTVPRMAEVLLKSIGEY